MAWDIFRNIASWWDVKSPHVSSFEEWEMWTSSLSLSSRRKQLKVKQLPKILQLPKTMQVKSLDTISTWSKLDIFNRDLRPSTFGYNGKQKFVTSPSGSSRDAGRRVESKAKLEANPKRHLNSELPQQTLLEGKILSFADSVADRSIWDSEAVDFLSDISLKAPLSATPTSDYDVSPEQLANMTCEHDFAVVQDFGGESL
ncbi:hypothetical protein Tco_1257084 [Tanacetum coccineum]